jgi:uncharacterized protein YyaL (SSP411 family)
MFSVPESHSMLHLKLSRQFALVVAVICLSSQPIAGDERAPDVKQSGRLNHLADETSPYLLQHAGNPVDWHPWGEAALAKAKQEGKPIFLSIGYSSCHWCHVMERESFTDNEIAKLLNGNFVCIKVDREERPDVDNIYMTSLQVYNQLNGGGRGGWPLSMFLTPDAEPFFGGTYFPARDGDREASTGFLSLIKKVEEVWRKSPERVKEDAKTITRFTKRELEGRQGLALKPVNESLLEGVQATLAEQFDSDWGGFGFSEQNWRQPKFPEPSNLIFLLDRLRRTNDEEAKKLVVVSLEKMSQGGIRDHLGGGFHRYSTDRYWRIPHFEKMLYDNGQLLTVYAGAFELTKRKEFEVVAREIADFVLRDLTDPAGGFYAALDAESEGEEGKYYRWTREEAKGALSEDEYNEIASSYGFAGAPNLEEHYYLPQRHEGSEGPTMSQGIGEKLLVERNKRKRPKTDTKILTADNGLMITGLADAGRILAEPRYIAAAESAADFVLANLRTADGRLLRTYGRGKAKLNAYVTDYAYFIEGLLALHRATDDKRWLDAADALARKQIELFHDEVAGDFYFTSDDHETLIARAKDPVDGAQPSANSVTTATLLYLADSLKNRDYLQIAEKTIGATAGLIETAPYAAPRMATNIPTLIELKRKLEEK